MTTNGDADATVAVQQDRKKRVRGGHKAHLTKMLADVAMQLSGYTDERKARVMTLKSCLERKASVLNKLDEEILEGIEDSADMATEIEAAENIQNQILENIIKIEDILKKDDNKDNIKPVLLGSEKRRNMKLPKYSVDDFYGDPKKWRAFRDAFDVAVAQNEDLSDVEKFHYLRGFLKGEARLAIDGLEITKDNYLEAWELLEGRFGNRQVIVNCHMEELCSIKGVSDKDDTKGLRRMYDNVEMKSARSQDKS